MPLVDEVKYALPYQSVYYIIAIFGVIFLIFSLLWWKNILKVAHRNTAEWFLSAGRNMKGGIVTASIVSTWTWAATIMVSSKMGYDYGISGPYWYAAGATIPILLFSVVAVYVKKLAPQLHTFPEFILYRYDKKTHWIMIIIGLLACTIVTTMVILGGALALNILTGINVKIAVLVIPLAFCFYSSITGLRGSIVTDYLQVAIILIIGLGLSVIFYYKYGDFGICNMVENFHDKGKFINITSYSGIMFGIVNTIGNFGTVFLDQTYWQRAIAVNYKSAGSCFLTAGLVWFAIPLCIATAFGVGGLALGINVSDSTIIAPLTAYHVSGNIGGIAFLVMLFMAIISTGNSESVAVASIIANDIYRLNIKPQATDRQILKISRFTTGLFGIIAGILSFLIYSIGVQVYFLYLAMGIFLSAGVLPIIFGIVWKRLSSFGAFWGTMLGFITGIIVWLVVAGAQDGSSLLVAMGEMVPMACANCTVVLVSGIVCLIDGYWLQSGKFDFSRIQLMVTSFLKKQEIKDIKGLRPVSKSDYFENMNSYFKTNARKIISLAIYSSLAMEVFFPVIMYFSGFSFSKGFFGYWIIGTLVWLMFSTGYTILIPIIDFFQADEAEQLYYE
ncbi:MAG TPA: sodium:solute symporter family protein [Candidatus Wujingus californicus]|uniref:sodium:solute symporter family protein n=1 Tax=Candidatus Wujingus californicus TaxID=3367618 RepID=UPI001E0F3CE4|nr:sodium:solute symporter family protein [Planctomycetota bacterium]MDO8094570.1 sodium:solute symporter family protein [Candidatus Brocadiales bacterium]MDO8130267.1 sodium:solute symporter family protein [Candidatus Brocadiales bacterium]